MKNLSGHEEAMPILSSLVVSGMFVKKGWGVGLKNVRSVSQIEREGRIEITYIEDRPKIISAMEAKVKKFNNIIAQYKVSWVRKIDI